MRTSIYLSDELYAKVLEEENRLKLTKKVGDKRPRVNDVYVAALEFYFNNTCLENIN